MDKKERNEVLIAILKDQVVPALGCTEPGAVAYAISRAKELLGGEIDSMEVSVDTDMLKNAMRVGIPGTPETGLPFACGLAAKIGKSKYVLQALQDVTPEAIEEAKAMVKAGKIVIHHQKDSEGIYIRVEAVHGADKAVTRIEDAHVNLCYEELNGKVLKDTSAKTVNCDDVPAAPTGIKFRIKEFTLQDMIDFANEVPAEDIAFMQDGIDMNMAISNEGLSYKNGIGSTLLKVDETLLGKAKAQTAAGSEARMSGSSKPVMSSAGSGNHGMTAVVPVNVVGTAKGYSKEKIHRSVALSHLVTNYIKVYLGPLTPICGCGVAAGLGAAAGLTYLQDGNYEQIRGAINNIAAGIPGMICDGAKMGCSIKVACAAGAAVDASELALKNIFIPSDNGILNSRAEDTMQNIAEVCLKGMPHTDDVILDLMLKNK